MHFFLLAPFIRSFSGSLVVVLEEDFKASNFPIYDDDFVFVYAIDGLFDLNFTLSPTNTTKSIPKTDLQCLKLESISRFGDASAILKSRGYSMFASFLDFQVMGFIDDHRVSENIMKWSVFAPVDEELVQFSGDFLAYSSLFMGYLVPCKMEWSDLDEMENGTVVSNNVEGFHFFINKDEDGEMLMVNGVEITFPDMCYCKWLVIHGIGGVTALPESSDEGMEFPDGKKNDVGGASICQEF